MKAKNTSYVSCFKNFIVFNINTVYNNYMDKKQQIENRQKKIIIAVVIITAFITTFTGSALNLSIPDIGSEFGVSAGFVGWLVTGYTLAVAAFSVPLGRLADITCRKAVLVTGILILLPAALQPFFQCL